MKDLIRFETLTNVSHTPFDMARLRVMGYLYVYLESLESYVFMYIHRYWLRVLVYLEV